MREVSLGEICEFQNGYAFKSSEWANSGREIIRIQNLTKGSAQVNYFEGTIDEKFVVRKGDILLSWSGTLGVYVWSGEEAVLNQHIFKVTPRRKEEVDADYLRYLLGDSVSKVSSQTHGSTMKHLTKGSLVNHTIILPPLEEQKRIAGILDEADRVRKKTQALIDKYDELAQSLFLNMFGDPVTNPKGWRRMELQEVCERILGGGTPSKSKPEFYSGTIPWVTPKDMKSDVIRGSIDMITHEAVDQSSAKLIPADSVLMVIRSGILKHTLPVAINDISVCINQDLKALIPDPRHVTSNFLFALIRSYESYLLGRVRAVTADNFDFKEIKVLEIPVPPLNLQLEYDLAVQDHVAQVGMLRASLSHSNDMLQSLLQKAFKGELT